MLEEDQTGGGGGLRNDEGISLRLIAGSGVFFVCVRQAG